MDGQTSASTNTPSDNHREIQGLRLQTRLLLLSVGGALIMSFLISLLVAILTGSLLSDHLVQGLEVKASHIIERLDRELYERWRDMQVLALTKTFTNPDVSVDIQRDMLNNVQDNYDYYAWIGFVTPDGVVRAATRGLLEGEVVDGRPWFIEGIKGIFFGDLHEAVLLQDQLSPGGLETLRFLDVAAPVYRDGELVGVLGAHLSWYDISAFIARLNDTNDSPDWLSADSEVLVLSGDGYVIMDTLPETPDSPYAINMPEALQRSAAPLARILHWPDGETYLTGYACSTGLKDFSGLGYCIVARQTQAAALRPVVQLQTSILGAGLVALGVYALFSYGILTALLRPLQQIVEGIVRLRSGEANIKLPVYTSRDEIGILSRALDDALSTLNQRNVELVIVNESLEKRVRERTDALERRARELANEIATRKQLEAALTESRESFRRLAETSLDGIAISVDGVIIYSNRAVMETFGYEQHELIRMAEVEFVAPESQHIIEDIFKLGDHSLHAVTGIRKNGERFPLEISGRTLRYAGSMAHVITLRDLSKRKTVSVVDFT